MKYLLQISCLAVLSIITYAEYELYLQADTLREEYRENLYRMAEFDCFSTYPTDLQEGLAQTENLALAHFMRVQRYLNTLFWFTVLVFLGFIINALIRFIRRNRVPVG